MPQRLIIRRDARGNPYLDHARDDEADCADVREHLRDGERLHVSMYMKDALAAEDASRRRRAAAAAEEAEEEEQDEEQEQRSDAAPALLVDAFGGSEGLNRPGARYLLAAHQTTDHARLVTAVQQRDEALAAAYADYDRAEAERWRGNDYDIAIMSEQQRKRPTSSRASSSSSNNASGREGDACSINGAAGRLRNVNGRLECVANRSSDAATVDARQALLDAYREYDEQMANAWKTTR
jgi:hypothetical protein